MSLQKIKSVLFVCSQNAIRSPMAEYLGQKHFPEIKFESAGSMPGYVDPFMPFVMQEIGINFDEHISKHIEDFELSKIDLIISLTPQGHHHVLEIVRDLPVETEYWPTQNPSQVAGNRDQILETYRKVRDRLEKQILDRFKS